MAQTWNDAAHPWQSTDLPWKNQSMPWNNTSLPWKQDGGGAPNAPNTPTLSAVGGLTTNDSTPDWDIVFATAPVAGDVLKWLRSGSAWGSHTITQPEIDAGVFTDYGMTALSEGANDITLIHSRGGADSVPSNTVTRTLDSTAPTLSSPSASALDYTSGTAAFTTNEANGVAFWVVVPSAATAPSAAQIIAGTDGSGNPATSDNHSSPQAVSGTSVTIASMPGLSAGTAYKAYMCQRDAAGNPSNVVNAAFTTALNALGAAGNETPSGSGTTWDMASRSYAAGKTVISFCGNSGTNYDIVSLKFHSPDVATDPTGTTITVSQKSGGVSGFTPMVLMGVLSLGSPTTGVIRAVFDNAGMYDVSAAYQTIVTLATITGGANNVQSGPTISCPNPGIIVAVAYIDGGGVSNVTWSTGSSEIFDVLIAGARRWSMAAYQTPGSTVVSYTNDGTVNITRGAAIAMGS